MGFRDTYDMVDLDREVPIHVPPLDIQEEMKDASINVDDLSLEEPNMDWDRDNPDVAVGVVYPNPNIRWT